MGDPGVTLPRRLAPAAAAGAALTVASAACIDLFHSTDFDTICSVDAAACSVDAYTPVADAAPEAAPTPDSSPAQDAADASAETGPPPPTNFCAWSSQQSHDNARHACAWLGACSAPIGVNAFGECLDRAILAYDCAVAPNRPVIGRAHAFWDCMWQVSTCDDVWRCVLPDGLRFCALLAGSGESAQCATGGAANSSTVLDCWSGSRIGPPDGGEACVIAGQTCTQTPTAHCAGSALSCTDAGSASCNTTHLVDCVDVGAGLFEDVGIDCANVGAGGCVLDGGLAGCAPTSDASCPQTADAGCDQWNAVGCPAGLSERVDCRALMEGAGNCSAAAPGRPWDVARACVPDMLECAPSSETCDDASVRACHRGKFVDVACSAYGLGPCAMQTNFLTKRPACTRP